MIPNYNPKTRALDVSGSYSSFALSARVPSICMFLSALSLMCFLALVAFDAWPEGVLVVSFFIGVIMSLQILVFGARLTARGVVRCGNGVRALVVGQRSESST
jgi:hypothetical protein